MATPRYDAEWFRAVLDALQELVLVKGDRSKLLWANQAFLDLYGMTNEQLSELIDAKHSDPDDTIQYVRDDHTVFTTGKPLVVTEAVTSGDGSVRYFETVKTVIRDPETGAVVRTVGLSRPAAPDRAEASEHGRAGRKTSLEFLRNIVSRLPLAIAAVDARQRIIASSTRFVSHFEGDSTTSSSATFSKRTSPSVPRSAQSSTTNRPLRSTTLLLATGSSTFASSRGSSRLERLAAHCCSSRTSPSCGPTNARSRRSTPSWPKKTRRSSARVLNSRSLRTSRRTICRSRFEPSATTCSFSTRSTARHSTRPVTRT